MLTRVQCVEQSELEKFDGAATGKYTIGLGLNKMGYCNDREDIYSMALTVVSSLLSKYNIDTNSIGRLEVGTETLLDKSKSVKTVLMQLFGDNTDIDGVDTINACYGGTNALFNAINWVESSSWDGRNAIVVAGDIALYAKGNARPTGGAGIVAMLIGPDAPLAVNTVHGTYMQHAYDFYKPDFTSEYPVVDGHYSVACYLRALDKAYQAYNKRMARLANGTAAADAKAGLDRFDYFCFHAPTCKQTAKGYARLVYSDYLANPTSPEFADFHKQFGTMDYDATLTDKNFEKALINLSKAMYKARVDPTIVAPFNLGNSYSACVYTCLVSLLCQVPNADLQGKTIGMFSYGSGLAASLFSIRVQGDVSEIASKLNLVARLDSRLVLSPEEYEKAVELRHQAHMAKDYEPSGPVDRIAPNTYYLTKIDGMFRRTYAVKEA